MRVVTTRLMSLQKFAASTFVAVGLGGCVSVQPPARLYSTEVETALVETTMNDDLAELRKLQARKDQKGAARLKRNEIVAARKYAIDMEYTRYELALTRDLQVMDFTTQMGSLALTQASLLVSSTATKDALNAANAIVTGADAAFNDKILRGKMVEAIQSSMRTARHERAAVVYANMRCSIKSYPLGMALSDLESYYRAGTLTAGLIKLSETVAEKEKKTGASAETQKSGDTNAQAKLAGEAVEAKLKLDAAAKVTAVTMNNNGQLNVEQKGSKGAHRCGPNDLGA